jgi:hypothetical protein
MYGVATCMPDSSATWLIQGFESCVPFNATPEKTKLHELDLSGYDSVKTKIMELIKTLSSESPLNSKYRIAL